MTIPLEKFRQCVAAHQDEPTRITICHGPPRCNMSDGSQCRWCYVLYSDDPRPTDQVLADMRRGN